MLQGSVSTMVDASPDNIWRVLVDKIDQVELNLPRPTELNMLQNEGDTRLRERVEGEVRILEEVFLDPAARKITYTLVDHPQYEGYISHQLLVSANNTSSGSIVAITCDWRIKDGEFPINIPDLVELANDDLFHLRELAEDLQLEEKEMELLNPVEGETLGSEDSQSAPITLL
jgi:hypothetical protein